MFTHRGRVDLTRSRDRHISLKHFGADRRPSARKWFSGRVRFQQRKRGGSCPRGARSANFLVEVQLGTGQQSSERRGARRPYCSLSGTLFLLGTSSPHCQLHFLFLYSWLRAGRVCRPKQTEMHSKPKEKKPRKSKAKANGALCASEPSQLPPNRSSGQQIPSGLKFQAKIDRPKSYNPVDEGVPGEGQETLNLCPVWRADWANSVRGPPQCSGGRALWRSQTQKEPSPQHSQPKHKSYQ